ncbi:MAG: diguanylate cyclase, partial [Planctomycetota bacterium]
NHGQQALEVLSRHVPDAIVMDITMPEMDGIDTLHAIRQQFNCIDLPVIMMTAETSSDRVVECFEAGANDYISKPVDLATLVVRLDSQLRLRTMHSDLLESQERYQLASAGTRDGIWDWNIRTDELYLSPRWRSLVGMEDPDAQLRGIQWLQYVMEEDRARVTAELQAHLNGETDYFETELRLTGPEKDHRWMLCRGLAVRDASNLPIRIAGSLSDVTEGKVADALTRLPNRLLFQDRVARCVQMYKRDPKRRFAIMYMDVNDFKLVNDSLGHDVGDAFLIQFAQRLQSELRQGDAVLARLGGDEFAVLLENISEEEDAVMVAKRLRTQIERPFQIAGREIISGLSIGIVTINEKNASAWRISVSTDAFFS